eukprot:scaffold162145_cov22-Prasinocladus_malaysianus.AAC.1
MAALLSHGYEGAAVVNRLPRLHSERRVIVRCHVQMTAIQYPGAQNKVFYPMGVCDWWDLHRYFAVSI